MKQRSRIMVAAVALMFTASGGAYGQSLLVSLSGCTLNYGYGCSNWTNVTAALNTAFAGNVATTTDLENYAQMLSYDAIFLDQRWTGGTLTAAEVTNLTNYIATGRRIVLMGENAAWAAWNSQLAQIVGGSYGNQTFVGTTPTATVHQLTAGVNSIQVPAGGVMEGLAAGGGLSLFTVPVASLWGAAQNALVMLDVNVWDNSNIGLEDNAAFLANTAQWLAGSQTHVIPEPVTMLLVGSGLVGVAAARRRRRTEGSPGENV